MSEANDRPEIITVTLGGRIYEFISLMNTRSSRRVSGLEVVQLASELEADLGEEDARWIMNYQSEIPTKLRLDTALVFTNWFCPGWPGVIAYVIWDVDIEFWLADCRILITEEYGDVRLVRRRVPDKEKSS